MRACVVRAYTLIEVIIVLALLTTMLLLISMAIDIHLRQMTINRTEVEEARLARVILETIAKDIRSVVVLLREEPLEVDTSALPGMTGLDIAGELFDGFDLEDWNEFNDYFGDDESSMMDGILPGIYGGSDWIRIDTARLPRGEMYGSQQIRRGTSSAADRLSASKTSLYYLGQDTGMLATGDPRYQPDRLMGSLGRSLDPNAPQYGLFRRQLDRQAAQFAIHEGLEWEYEREDELLAPEVESLQFLYFDPTIDQLGMMGGWIDEWDMDVRQMLPSAVKIIVGIRRPDIGSSMLSWGQTDARESVVYYSLIVPVQPTIDVILNDFYGEEWLDGMDLW